MRAGDADGGAALNRRSRGGSRQDLKVEGEHCGREAGAAAAAAAAATVPSPLPTHRRRPPLSPLLLLSALLLLLMVASGAVVKGLQIVGRARAFSSGGGGSRTRPAQGSELAAAARQDHHQQQQQQQQPPSNHHGRRRRHPPLPDHPHHVTVAIADLHGDWPHAVVALRAAGVLTDAGARALPTPEEAERDWRLPSRHTLPLAAGELFALPPPSLAPPPPSSSSSSSQTSGGGEGGTLHLVQTGDLVDRGRHGLALVRLFGALRDVARRSAAAGAAEGAAPEAAEAARSSGGSTSGSSGGRATVELLLGNHELLNLQGEAARYAHAAELRAVASAEEGGNNDDGEGEEEEEDGGGEGGQGGGEREQQEELTRGARAWARLMALGGDLGEALRRDRAVAHVAGRGPCRALFVHAGLTPGLLSDLATKAANVDAAADAAAAAAPASSSSADEDRERQPAVVRAINRAAAAALGECGGGGGEGEGEGEGEGDEGCPPDLGARHPLGPLLLSGQGPVWTRALAPDGRGGAYRSNGQLALVCAAVDDVLRRVGDGGGAGRRRGAGARVGGSPQSGDEEGEQEERGGNDDDDDDGDGDDTATGAPRRLVVGHTITRTDGSPTVACGGRLIFLDIGMSRAMWGGDDEDEEEEGEEEVEVEGGGGEGEGRAGSRPPPFAGPSPALALRCEYGPGKPGAAELVFARPKRGHERDDMRTAPLDVRRMPLPALGEVPALGAAAAAG